MKADEKRSRANCNVEDGLRIKSDTDKLKNIKRIICLTLNTDH